MAESTEQNPSKLKRLKKTNFTVAEEDLIQQLVEKHSSVINGKLTNTVTNQLKKKVWDDIAIKVNSLGVAIRTATEVRNKWRNTTRVAKAVYTTHRSELFKTGGGPAPKQPSSAVESYPSYEGHHQLQGDSDQPSINATLPEEDASQDLYESAASLIRDSHPLQSTKTVRTPLKKVTVQDIHDMQYRALQGKLEIQEKQKVHMDLKRNNWNQQTDFRCRSRQNLNQLL
ncbi:unnamed protein product [Mytilus edulis]|uniref:Myb-like domain-containing protein n=1 Tax=Mytilus edulis TaxID=6550 RepID=A0A8S3V496_MYTED|nr:unnamed protein product [Mytilus edulis]